MTQSPPSKAAPTSPSKAAPPNVADAVAAAAADLEAGEAPAAPAPVALRAKFATIRAMQTVQKIHFGGTNFQLNAGKTQQMPLEVALNLEKKGYLVITSKLTN